MAAGVMLAGCGPASVLTNSDSDVDAGAVHVTGGTTGSAPATGGTSGTSPAVGDAGSTSATPDPLPAPTPTVDGGSTSSTGSADAGTTTTGTTTGTTGATSGTTGTAAANPSFGSWAWGAPDVTAVARAGFTWFESGYPGTLSASDNAYLTQHGVVPFAYINMSEVPNSDASLQGQIGAFWSSISLCANSGWNTTVVDVRDSRWQDWLIRRANAAYDLGNRGIKWDVAGVESLCSSWSGSTTAPAEAIAAMASVMSQLKAQHPDFKFIVNQGFGLAEQHPELVDGFELENMINYADANPGDAWSAEMISRVGAIHVNQHIPILDLEYYDLFGCSDTTCAQASTIYDQVVQLDWVPYITVVTMNVQGRGLNITAPW